MKLIINILCVTLAVTARSQSLERFVIGSTGAFTTSANMQLSSTVGETVIATAQSGSFIVTQGFQQPDTTITTGIAESQLKIDYTLYPNPTAGQVKLVLTVPDWTCTFRVSDVQGKTIETRENIQVTGTQTEQFDLSGFAAGTYFISLFNGEKMVQTFKVQKID